MPQQIQHSRKHSHTTTIILLVAVLLALTGCSGSGDDGADTRHKVDLLETCAIRDIVLNAMVDPSDEVLLSHLTGKDDKKVKCLIKHGAIPTNKNFSEFIREGKTDLIKFALKKGSQLPPDVLLATSDPKMRKFLMKNGAGLETKDSEGSTPLMLAIKRAEDKEDDANTRVALELLELGADVNAHNNQGESTLWIAMEQPSPVERLIRAICDRGVDVNAPRPTGETPLWYATQKEHTKLAAILLDKGAKFDAAVHSEAVDESINTPFKLAMKEGRGEILELMVANGADVKSMWGGRHELAELLFQHTAKDNFSMVEFLLNHGADANSEIDGVSALQQWFKNSTRDMRTASALLRKGANPNVSDGKGNALLTALAGNSYFNGVLKLALEKGANPDSVDKDGKTAIYWAFHADEQSRRKVDEDTGKFKMLSKDERESYRAEWYSRIKNEGNVALLLKSGAIPDAFTLQQAINAMRTDIVQCFLDNGADANAVAESRRIPMLHYAIYRITTNFNHKEDVRARQERENATFTTIAKALIEKGANVNATDSNGETPLMYAARNNSEELVRLLIKKGADVNAANRSGKTALSMTDSGKIIDILEAAGARTPETQQ